MAQCTDKQRIERLLVPAMLQVVLTIVQRGLEEDADALDEVTQYLMQALREPVDGLPPEKVAKLVRRAKRATEMAMGPLHNQLVGVQLLAVAQFAANLTEKDVLVVGADSSFSKAWDLIAEVLDCAWDELHRNGLANQMAREMSARLASLGYFLEASA